MARQYRYPIAIKHLLLSMGLSLLLGTGAWSQTIRMSTHDLRPYTFYDEQNQFSGQAFDVLNCALSDIGYALDVVVVPWQRAQNMARKGDVDGFFAASQKAERDTYAQLSRPIADQDWVWFWSESRPLRPEDIHPDSDLVFGSFLGANMQFWLESQGFPTTSRLPATTELLIRMVMSGRLDVGLANRQVLEAELAGESVVTSLAQEKPLGAYIRHDWLRNRPGFMADLNTAIVNCRPIP